MRATEQLHAIKNRNDYDDVVVVHAGDGNIELAVAVEVTDRDAVGLRAGGIAVRGAGGCLLPGRCGSATGENSHQADDCAKGEAPEHVRSGDAGNECHDAVFLGLVSRLD